MLRMVIVFKYERDQAQKWQKVEDGTALFHQWGVDYEEFETGPGNYSVAIVERPDGSIENVQPEMVRFIKPLEFKS
jgi:hypothetical protein